MTKTIQNNPKQRKQLGESLPEWLPPVLTNEIRQGLRRKFFVIPFILMQFLALGAVIYEFHLAASGADLELDTEYAGLMNLGMFFWPDTHSGPLWAVIAFICIIFMPLTALGLMRNELNSNNHELLRLTPLRRWAIIREKFLLVWLLPVLAFTGLLPYVITRYLTGGINIWRNIALVGTVILASAVMGAGALGASSYRGLGTRLCVFLLFIVSMCVSHLVVLIPSTLLEKKAGIAFHINAILCASGYIILGLILARAHLRQAYFAHEMKPGHFAIGMLFLTPIIASISTSFTLGLAGGLGIALAVFLLLKTGKRSNAKRLPTSKSNPRTNGVKPPPLPPPIQP